MRQITCPNASCATRVPFMMSQAGQVLSCPGCDGRLLLPHTDAIELPTSVAGNPYSIPITAALVLFGAIIFSGLSILRSSGPKHPATDGHALVASGMGNAMSGPGAAPGKSSGGGRKVALVIGVENDLGSGFKKLDYTGADATELGNVLKEVGYATTVMTDSATEELKPNAANIRKELDNLIDQSDEAEMVLVSFAGHGVEAGGRYLLCPAEANLKKNDTLISINEVYDYLAKCRAKQKFLIADTPRIEPGGTGMGKQEVVATAPDPQKVSPPRGIRAYFSCSADETSYERRELKRGLFFYFLIAGLKGAADLDKDGQITFPELEQYVNKQVADYSIREHVIQRPYAQGQAPGLPVMAVCGGVERLRSQKDVEQQLRRDPSTLFLDEFATLRGALPPNWSTTSFAVTPDERTKRESLKSTRAGGFHYFDVPVNTYPIRGDFAIQIDFALGMRFHENYHKLEIRLYGQQGIVIPIQISGDGDARIADNSLKNTTRFRRYELNTLQIVREGNSFTLLLNGEVVDRKGAEYAGPIEDVVLGLSGGKDPGSNRNDIPAQIYSLRIIQLSTLPNTTLPDLPNLPSKVLLRERFDRVPAGSTVPENWTEGHYFSVRQDDIRHRPCLENARREGLNFVTLPPLTELTGDFAIELSYALTVKFHNNPQVLHLRLEGDGSIADTWIDAKGQAKLLENAIKSPPQDYHESENQMRRAGHAHWLRLVRQGESYKLFLDDRLLDNARWARFPVQKIRLGLTAEYDGSEIHNHPARVYGVTVSSLMPANPLPPPLERSYSEDFLVNPGDALPDRWELVAGSGKFQTGADKYSGWLELTKGSMRGQAKLPCPELGEYFMICQSVVFRSSGLYALNFGSNLTLWLDSEGKLAINGVVLGIHKEKMSRGGESNSLEVGKRSGRPFIRLNGKNIDLPAGFSIPSQVRISIGLAREKDKEDTLSPRLTRICITP